MSSVGGAGKLAIFFGRRSPRILLCYAVQTLIVALDDPQIIRASARVARLGTDVIVLSALDLEVAARAHAPTHPHDFFWPGTAKQHYPGDPDIDSAERYLDLEKRAHGDRRTVLVATAANTFLLF